MPEAGQTLHRDGNRRTIDSGTARPAADRPGRQEPAFPWPVDNRSDHRRRCHPAACNCGPWHYDRARRRQHRCKRGSRARQSPLRPRPQPDRVEPPCRHRRAATQKPLLPFVTGAQGPRKLKKYWPSLTRCVLADYSAYHGPARGAQVTNASRGKPCCAMLRALLPPARNPPGHRTQSHAPHPGRRETLRPDRRHEWRR